MTTKERRDLDILTEAPAPKAGYSESFRNGWDAAMLYMHRKIAALPDDEASATPAPTTSGRGSRDERR